MYIHGKAVLRAFSKKKDEALTEEDKAKNYQVMQAKAAIVHGGAIGMGLVKVH